MPPTRPVPQRPVSVRPVSVRPSYAGVTMARVTCVLDRAAARAVSRIIAARAGGECVVVDLTGVAAVTEDGAATLRAAAAGAARAGVHLYVSADEDSVAAVRDAGVERNLISPSAAAALTGSRP